MSRWSKVWLLVSLLLKRPEEFIDRVKAIVDIQIDRHAATPVIYNSLQDAEAIQLLENIGWNLRPYLNELYLAEIEQAVQMNIAQLAGKSPFLLIHNADLTLARLCYALCRFHKPEIFIETGTAHGVTTAYILKALSINQKGVLYSIDLPPLGKDADAFVGILVPKELRSRWHLLRGTSRRLLPALLQEIGKVDVFLHDSLHTYSNILFELNVVTPCLNPPAVVLVDDIEQNAAFENWVAHIRPAMSFSVRETQKQSAFGVAIVR